MKNANVLYVVVATLCLVAAGLLGCMFLGGCTPQDVKEVRQEVAALKAQAATMPSGPARDEVVKNLTKAENTLGEWESYVGFAAGVTGLAVGVYQRFKKGQMVEHLTNVINSVEAVLPEKDAETKIKLAALQGPATSAVVDEIKNGK